MGHVDPHTIKVIPQAAKRFFRAKQYAIVGRVLSDPSRFDNKIIKWYNERSLPLTPVRNNPKFPNTEPIEGLKAIENANQLPDLNNTSISVIINPALGLPILKDLFAQAQTAPHTVWLQPGAESAEIEAFIKEHGLEDKFVIGGPCILVHGDAAREGKANL